MRVTSVKGESGGKFPPLMDEFSKNRRERKKNGLPYFL